MKIDIHAHVVDRKYIETLEKDLTLKMAHELVGADHLLWGSDDPFIGSDSAHVEKMAIPQADKAKILGGNAARLLKLKVAA